MYPWTTASLYPTLLFSFSLSLSLSCFHISLVRVLFSPPRLLHPVYTIFPAAPHPGTAFRTREKDARAGVRIIRWGDTSFFRSTFSRWRWPKLNGAGAYATRGKRRGSRMVNETGRLSLRRAHVYWGLIRE